MKNLGEVSDFPWKRGLEFRIVGYSQVVSLRTVHEKKSGGNGVFDEMMGFFEVRFSHIFTARTEIRESRQCLEY